MQLTIKLHREQYRFCHGAALFRGFVGGRGAGKSFVGAYDLLRRAKPGRLYGAYAPTYPMLRDAALRSFLDIGEKLHFIRDVAKSDMRVTLGNGAEVLFRSLDDPERARGPNLSGAWIDEASLTPLEAYTILIACLREGGEQGWLSSTFTPKGRFHWTYEVFGGGRPDTELFKARTSANTFLPNGFEDTLRQQYTGQFAAQELGGDFVDLQGNLARREWFPIVDIAPAQAQRHRHWDFAASGASVKGSDPDFTVGARLSLADGVYYVEDIARGRFGPGAVERTVLQTAAMDSKGVPVTFEQEPGSAGILFTAALVRVMAGYNVRAVPVSGDKVTRAMPFLRQAEAGNVRLVRGGWNLALIDELVAFPEGAHDDQVDALSGAFGALTQHGWSRGPRA
jgi:predicted phage terminase large subunit-like protein